jgi:hypothetical protein
MGAGSICSTTHSFFCFSGESQMSARGISLHIGVNRCNPDHYRGWEGPLKSCENDVETMQVIAKSRGFEASTLKTEQATRDAVKAAITGAARELSAGDFFLVSYSGHGGRVRDVTGEESDQKDDTWCLYDGQLLDDELNVMFAAFAAGVRILVVSDSCHSGTLLKGESDPQNQAEIDDDFIIPRAMPRKAASDTYKSNRSFYTQIQDDLPVPRPGPSITCSKTAHFQTTIRPFIGKSWPCWPGRRNPRHPDTWWSAGKIPISIDNRHLRSRRCKCRFRSDGKNTGRKNPCCKPGWNAQPITRRVIPCGSPEAL